MREETLPTIWKNIFKNSDCGWEPRDRMQSKHLFFEPKGVDEDEFMGLN